MNREEWRRSQGKINETAALRREYALKRKEMGELERKRRGVGPARVDWEPYVQPKTREEKDRCREFGANTPKQRDAIVRRMRAAQ